LPASYSHRLTTITDIDSDEIGSSQARRELAIAALRIILSNPVLGTGIGTDTLALNEQIGPSWHAVHIVYLQYGVDLGLPGLGLFLALFATCLASASAARRAPGRSRNARAVAHLGEATWTSLIAFGVAALFHPVAYHFYFYYLAGLATACRVIFAQRIRHTKTAAAVHLQ